MVAGDEVLCGVGGVLHSRGAAVEFEKQGGGDVEGGVAIGIDGCYGRLV